MRIFYVIVVMAAILFGISNRIACAQSNERVEVRNCTTFGGRLSDFQYGVISNQLCYVVLELGNKIIKPHTVGHLRIGANGAVFGDQHLHLDTIDIDLPSTKRLFVIDEQVCYSEPLTMSLSELEAELKHPIGLSDVIRKRIHFR